MPANSLVSLLIIARETCMRRHNVGSRYPLIRRILTGSSGSASSVAEWGLSRLKRCQTGRKVSGFLFLVPGWGRGTGVPARAFVSTLDMCISFQKYWRSYAASPPDVRKGFAFPQTAFFD